MKLLKTENAITGNLTYQVEKGQFGLFLIRFEGTNITGQAVNLQDLGNVIMRWNGNDIINCDFEFLNQVSNLYGGFTEFTSTTGGSFKASAFIPSSLWFDSLNVYDIGEEDKVEFVLNWSTSKISSGSVYLLAKPRRGLMHYIHAIKKRVVVSGGAGIITDNIVEPNIATYYIKNASSLISRLQIERDGKAITDANVGAIQSYSDWTHLLEASSNLLAVEFAESKDVREAVSNTLTIRLQFIASGNLETYYSQLIPRPDKIDISTARALQ